jgi:hypothetical protein
VRPHPCDLLQFRLVPAFTVVTRVQIPGKAGGRELPSRRACIVDGKVAMSWKHAHLVIPFRIVLCFIRASDTSPVRAGAHQQAYVRTAHKTHIRFAIGAVPANCANRGISNLLKTEHRKSFNSVPGHHVSNHLRPKWAHASTTWIGSSGTVVQSGPATRNTNIKEKKLTTC